MFGWLKRLFGAKKVDNVVETVKETADEWGDKVVDSLHNFDPIEVEVDPRAESRRKELEAQLDPAPKASARAPAKKVQSPVVAVKKPRKPRAPKSTS